MRIRAASCTTLRPLLDAPTQPLRILSVSPAAIYFAGGDFRRPWVLGVISFDAVPLPGCLVLPQRATELPLSTLAPASDAVAGDGHVTWRGRDGELSVVAARYRPPGTVAHVPLRAENIAQLAAALRGSDIGIELDIDATPRPQALLGLGPGLTPSGDDVLAGFLLGARAFGLDADELAATIGRLAPRRTTTLSAALLRHAAAGRCAPAVAGLINACAGSGDLEARLRAVRSIGATSGTALALGVLTAATRVCAPNRVIAAEPLATSAGPHEAAA